MSSRSKIVLRKPKRKRSHKRLPRNFDLLERHMNCVRLARICHRNFQTLEELVKLNLKMDELNVEFERVSDEVEEISAELEERIANLERRDANQETIIAKQDELNIKLKAKESRLKDLGTLYKDMMLQRPEERAVLGSPHESTDDGGRLEETEE